MDYNRAYKRLIDKANNYIHVKLYSNIEDRKNIKDKIREVRRLLRIFSQIEALPNNLLIGYKKITLEKIEFCKSTLLYYLLNLKIIRKKRRKSADNCKVLFNGIIAIELRKRAFPYSLITQICGLRQSTIINLFRMYYPNLLNINQIRNTLFYKRYYKNEKYLSRHIDYRNRVYNLNILDEFFNIGEKEKVFVENKLDKVKKEIINYFKAYQ